MLHRAAAADADRTIRVLLTADVRLHREGLAEILAYQEGLKVVEAAASVDEAAAAACELHPDVAILDLGHAEGLEATRVLASAAPDVRIIAMCVAETEAEVVSWAEAGAGGYVTPDASSLIGVRTNWTAPSHMASAPARRPRPACSSAGSARWPGTRLRERLPAVSLRARERSWS